MPETIATQWLLAFLYSMPYVTCQIQTEQNQGKNMWAVEFKLQVRQTSLSRILHLFCQHMPSNDNPNYIIQVGNVFGFIISIEYVL